MGTSDPRIHSVRLAQLTTRYPRTVGRNARLGSHGAGPDSHVAVLVTDDGRTGWGLVEGPPGDVGRVEGRPLSELIDPAVGVLDEADRWLDIALHDLLGVVLDAPVHALLGGHGSADVQLYDGAIYFDDLDPEEAPRGIDVLLEECRADAALGYRDFKLKIGRGNLWLPRDRGDARDIEVTRAIRAAFPDARILVDANDGYDLDGFLTYLEAVADVGLYWVEEPFLDDADDLKALRSWLDTHSPETRIAEGETSPDVAALLPVAAAGAIDVLLMDVMSYGLTAWRGLMPELAAAGVHGSPHAWGRPLKTRYAAHLAAGLGNVEVVEGVPGEVAGVDPRLLRPVDGVLRLDGAPGFGIPLPEETHLRPVAAAERA
jgi:L-alanine-DL-glutamate epimerase-like enolase superfamily enzyme